jgi:2-polyprenyl-3-methyl-5-hydroxy-6-metoxy-1,4-benzoquinol methylase
VRDAPHMRILECRSCGLVALESAAHIHADHYRDSGMHGQSVPTMESWLRQCEWDDRRRFESLSAAIANRRVLDFGCGAGGFVHLAAGLACDVVGVEVERRVQDFWRDRHRIVDSVAAAGGNFDVVTAFHVVEHLVDPRRMLTELAAVLAPGGTLIVEVPSADDALLTLFDCAPFQRFTYWSQHLFLFNPATLRALAVQAGLEVVAIRQVQRYPLSNHLHWLSRSTPGGHQLWSFLDSPALTQAYGAALAAQGLCDTLVAHLGRS